jgi:hypothetical protein
MLTQWVVVVTGPQLIEDRVRHTSDDQLSSLDAFAEVICHAHTWSLTLVCDKTPHIDGGPGINDDGFHRVDVIRSQLTRNIAARLSNVQDETVAAFAEYIPTKGNKFWVKRNPDQD